MARSPNQLANLKRGNPETYFNSRTALEAKKKSDATKRKKKTMREIFKEWAKSPTIAEDFKKMKRNVGVDDETNMGLLVAASIFHGMKGNSKYMDMVMQMMGEELVNEAAEESGFLEAISSNAAEDWNEGDVQV